MVCLVILVRASVKTPEGEKACSGVIGGTGVARLLVSAHFVLFLTKQQLVFGGVLLVLLITSVTPPAGASPRP